MFSITASRYRNTVIFKMKLFVRIVNNSKQFLRIALSSLS